jgi:transcriptional regulator with XRE-family HTH domain
MQIEHTEPGVIFGQRVRHVRKRCEWTQAELAQRMKDLGHPLDQAAVARIESRKPTTRQQNVTLREVLAFAAALGVSPAFLFLPLGEDDEVKIGSLQLPADHVREWLVGRRPLREEDDRRIFETERDTRSLAVMISAERALREERRRSKRRKKNADAAAFLRLLNVEADIAEIEGRGEAVPPDLLYERSSQERQLDRIRAMTLDDWQREENADFAEQARELENQEEEE